MSVPFVLLTIVFIVLSAAMILIILVQRPQGGGLAGAFGGSGGTSSETVFGGRVGDALTVATTIAFIVWLGFAISLNLMSPTAAAPGATPANTTAEDGTTPIDALGDGTTRPAGEPDASDPGLFDSSVPVADDDTTGGEDEGGSDTEGTAPGDAGTGE